MKLPKRWDFLVTVLAVLGLIGTGCNSGSNTTPDASIRDGTSDGDEDEHHCNQPVCTSNPDPFYEIEYDSEDDPDDPDDPYGPNPVLLADGCDRFVLVWRHDDDKRTRRLVFGVTDHTQTVQNSVTVWAGEPGTNAEHPRLFTFGSHHVLIFEESTGGLGEPGFESRIVGMRITVGADGAIDVGTRQTLLDHAFWPFITAHQDRIYMLSVDVSDPPRYGLLFAEVDPEGPSASEPIRVVENTIDPVFISLFWLVPGEDGHLIVLQQDPDIPADGSAEIIILQTDRQGNPASQPVRTGVRAYGLSRYKWAAGVGQDAVAIRSFVQKDGNANQIVLHILGWDGSVKYSGVVVEKTEKPEEGSFLEHAMLFARAGNFALIYPQLNQEDDDFVDLHLIEVDTTGKTVRSPEPVGSIQAYYDDAASSGPWFCPPIVVGSDIHLILPVSAVYYKGTNSQIRSWFHHLSICAGD
jgi:hypothetical protein